MVEYVKIRGKKYPVKFGYYVLKKVKEETGANSLKEAFQRDEDGQLKAEDTKLFEAMLWGALRQGAWEEEQDLDLKEDEMDMALGSCFEDFVKILFSAKFHPQSDDKELQDALGKLEEAEEEMKKQENDQMKRKK